MKDTDIVGMLLGPEVVAHVESRKVADLMLQEVARNFQIPARILVGAPSGSGVTTEAMRRDFETFARVALAPLQKHVFDFQSVLFQMLFRRRRSRGWRRHVRRAKAEARRR